MPTQATTGLSGEQFDELVERLERVVHWSSGRGRPRALTLRRATQAVLTYFHTNVSEEFIAELMETDQSTVSRAIAALEGPIAEVLADQVPELTEVLGRGSGVVDGALCPCWSWADAPELYSGKHKTTGHSHVFVADLDGGLGHISEPVDGNTHDAKAIKETGTLDLLDPGTTVGDKGFIGLGMLTPYRKPPGGELLEWQKDYNTAINKIRYVIERAIANFKTWRCMHTDYRRPRRTYHNAFHAVRALHFFKLRFA